MNKQEYVAALNREIQKLNGVIDLKILSGSDYRREATRHRKLLSQLRKEEAKRSMGRLFRFLTPSYR